MTLVRELHAPGKLFLAGEYAVLEPGRAALVLAVDRRLRATLRPEANLICELLHRPSSAALSGALTGDARAPIAWKGGVPGELRFAARAVELGLRLCAEEGLAPHGFQLVFENDFDARVLGFEAGESLATKPGLGGSACASVLAVRAACLAQERSVSAHEVLALASAAHWVEQGGRGSGADVAASSLGGALEARVIRAPASAEEWWRRSATALVAEPLVEARALAVPDDLRWLAVWSGASADTRVLLREVRAFQAARGHLFRACIERISSRAESLQSALGAAARDPGEAPREAVLASVREAAAAMAALGEQAGCAIVTPALAEICALASVSGCAGKPSGAGGGDCALVLAFSESARASAQARLRARGYASATVDISPPQP